MMKKIKLTEKQLEAKKLAAKLLEGNYVFMDTETTGVTNNDEVVNLAFIDKDTQMVYNSYFKPSIKMTPEASAVSGITDEFLANKPSILEEWENIKKALNSRRYAIYNKSFDERMIRATMSKLSLHTYNIKTDEFIKNMPYFKEELEKVENEKLTLKKFNSKVKKYCDENKLKFDVEKCDPLTLRYFINEVDKHGNEANIDIKEEEVNEMLKDAVCTMMLYDQYVGVTTWIKMEEACHAEGINIEQNHLADGDVTMMVELMKEVAKENKVPSIKAVYENILETNNKDSNYKQHKQNNIINDIINNVENIFKESLLENFPKTTDDLTLLMKKSYIYDMKLDSYSMSILKNRMKETFNYIKKNYNYLHQNINLRKKSEVELYNEGYSIDNIIKIKETTKYDLEGKLKQAFIQNPGCIDLSKFVDPKYTDFIIKTSQEIGDKLKPIKNLLPPEVTYFNIGIVLAYYQTGRIEELKEKSKNNYYDTDRMILVSVQTKDNTSNNLTSTQLQEIKNSNNFNDLQNNVANTNSTNNSNSSNNIYENIEDSFEIKF